MRYELLFPGDYLRGVDLLAGERVVTITAVKVEKLQKKGTSKVKAAGVMTIAESERKIVLCRTNGDAIAQLYGKDTSDWIGKRITIYYDPSVMFGRDKVGGIRVRPSVPKGKPEPLPKQTDATGDGPPPSDVELAAGTP